MKKIAFLIFMAVAFALQASAQLPSVELKDINGKTVRTDQLSNDGKPFIISFSPHGANPATVNCLPSARFTTNGARRPA